MIVMGYVCIVSGIIHLIKCNFHPDQSVRNISEIAASVYVVAVILCFK